VTPDLCLVHASAKARDARQQVVADLHRIWLPPPVRLPELRNVKLVYLLLHRRSIPYKPVSFIPHRY
jgi:hypothetical protein